MPKDTPKSIEFHYVKSNSFRTFHCDGVWGGITPRGYISMSCYSERFPIPRSLTLEFSPEGEVGAETARDTKQGLVREVGVELMMDVPLAEVVIAWLQEKVQDAKARAEASPENS